RGQDDAARRRRDRRSQEADGRHAAAARPPERQGQAVAAAASLARREYEPPRLLAAGFKAGRSARCRAVLVTINKKQAIYRWTAPRSRDPNEQLVALATTCAAAQRHRKSCGSLLSWCDRSPRQHPRW